MRRLLLAVAAAVTVAAGSAPLLVDAAVPATAATPAPASGQVTAPAAQRSVEIVDLAGELSESDERMLGNKTPEITLPADVTQVTYILFPDNDDNLNDTVRAFAEDERSDLITAERDKWAAGQLIVAVGLDPRRMGVYCGDDVCASVGIYDSGRLDGILDRMEGPLRDGNWAAGLLQGAIASGDPSARRDGGSGGSGGSGDGGAGWLGWAIGGGAGALALGVGGMAVASMRRKQVADARDQFDEVQRDYGRVAQDLQAIDVRAHSLTSPLANDALRGQWEEVKTGFLGLDATFDELDGLTADADDAEFRRRRTAIATAHEQVTRMRTAEENIETLARMEHGDAEVRRRELTEMHEDALAAQVSLEDPTLKEQLGALDSRILDLRSRLDSPTFMDEFADLISAHRVFVEAAQRHLYAESGVDESEDEDRRAPAVWESSWRPGYGYGNYIPFGIVHSWHSQDQQAAESAASSSSATTGYSGGGFSGGGGSRGF